jgi:TPR repeat protein
MYKDGRGVAKDVKEATRLMGQAAKADFLDAEVEYAIALFNGTGVQKDEAAGTALFRKAAMQGSPIAQNRLARIFAFVRAGTSADPVQAIKWHLISKAGGNSDLELDAFMQRQSPETRAAGEKAAKPWVDLITPVKESP